MSSSNNDGFVEGVVAVLIALLWPLILRYGGFVFAVFVVFLVLRAFWWLLRDCYLWLRSRFKRNNRSP